MSSRRTAKQGGDDDSNCRVLKIAIIGSGLSSLATAISLHQAVEEEQAEQEQQPAADAAAADKSSSEEYQAQGREQDDDDDDEQSNAKQNSRRNDTTTTTTTSSSSRRNTNSNSRRRIIQVTIYERDESLSSRQEGYGLTLTYHPTGLLQQLGVLEDIARWDNPSRSHYILSGGAGPSSGTDHGNKGGGTILGYFGNAFFSSSNSSRNSNNKTTTTSSRSNTTTNRATSIAARAAAGWGQRGNLRVPRQRVRQILLDKLHSFAAAATDNNSSTIISSQVCWGHKLVDMKHVLVDDENEEEEHKEEEEAGTCCRSDRRAKNGTISDDNNSVVGGSAASCTRAKIIRRPRKRRRKMIQLDFANGQQPHAYADLVIGADGIRSTVSRLWVPTAPAPRPLHIRLILGLTTASSFAGDNDDDQFYALLKECGFYTLDIGIRLFVMPYAGNSLAEHEDRLFSGTGTSDDDVDHDSDNQTNSNVEPPCNNNRKQGSSMRYMWQLSFATNKDDEEDDDDDDDMDQRQQWTGEELQREALARCKDWHAPVQDLIQATMPSAIWSSHLYDRDPQALAQALLQRQQQEKQREQQLQQQQRQQRDRAVSADGSDDNDDFTFTTSTPSVLLVGDALHAMSPFKVSADIPLLERFPSSLPTQSLMLITTSLSRLFSSGSRG
jgi:2-polyprenyl-6-methoxyphenol hydroxylase-like FAD-dependent oxidoreductase